MAQYDGKPYQPRRGPEHPQQPAEDPEVHAADAVINHLAVMTAEVEAMNAYKEDEQEAEEESEGDGQHGHGEWRQWGGHPDGRRGRGGCCCYGSGSCGGRIVGPTQGNGLQLCRPLRAASFTLSIGAMSMTKCFMSP